MNWGLCVKQPWGLDGIVSALDTCSPAAVLFLAPALPVAAIPPGGPHPGMWGIRACCPSPSCEGSPQLQSFPGSAETVCTAAHSSLCSVLLPSLLPRGTAPQNPPWGNDACFRLGLLPGVGGLEAHRKTTDLLVTPAGFCIFRPFIYPTKFQCPPTMPQVAIREQQQRQVQRLGSWCGCLSAGAVDKETDQESCVKRVLQRRVRAGTGRDSTVPDLSPRRAAPLEAGDGRRPQGHRQLQFSSGSSHSWEGRGGTHFFSLPARPLRLGLSEVTEVPGRPVLRYSESSKGQAVLED